jgi:hypothetical protein
VRADHGATAVKVRLQNDFVRKNSATSLSRVLPPLALCRGRRYISLEFPDTGVV